LYHVSGSNVIALCEIDLKQVLFLPLIFLTFVRGWIRRVNAFLSKMRKFGQLLMV